MHFPLGCAPTLIGSQCRDSLAVHPTLVINSSKFYFLLVLKLLFFGQKWIQQRNCICTCLHGVSVPRAIAHLISVVGIIIFGRKNYFCSQSWIPQLNVHLHTWGLGTKIPQLLIQLRGKSYFILVKGLFYCLMCTCAHMVSTLKPLSYSFNLNNKTYFFCQIWIP